MKSARVFGPRNVVLVGSFVALGLLLRRRYLRFGATAKEVDLTLAGDDLLPHADVTATRAVTIRASAGEVWPWIVQIGQGRGGFYSYDFLENLVGCDIHSSDRVVPKWQHLAVGDEIRLHPTVALTVTHVESERALVLSGDMPIGRTPSSFDSTWAFILRPGPESTTRLIVRDRYQYSRPWAALIVEPTALVSCVMTERMLRRIKDRVEQAVAGRVPAIDVRAPRRGRLGAERAA